jgi:alpha-D-ribose 1-methylphosphonate 5-triphosphate synthase subunit PhnG
MRSDHNTNPNQAERARWMSILAKAPAETLAAAVERFGELPAYLWLRKPETGLAMVRARTGGSGSQFNLGEMSMTRCALRLSSGETGLAYVAGRNVRHAEWAAIFDALMQTEAKAIVQSTVIAPLEKVLTAKRAEIVAEAKASKVEFMTMVRGEDA